MAEVCFAEALVVVAVEAWSAVEVVVVACFVVVAVVVCFAEAVVAVVAWSVVALVDCIVAGCEQAGCYFAAVDVRAGYCLVVADEQVGYFVPAGHVGQAADYD